MTQRTGIRVLSAFLAGALTFLLLPPVAFGSDGIGEATAGDSHAFPYRDAAYYQEFFPEVDLNAHTESQAIDVTQASPDSMRPDSNSVPCYGDGYFDQELMIWTAPGILDSEVRDIIAPLGDANLLGITGNSEDGLSITVRIEPEASVSEAAATLMSDSRVQSVERNSYTLIDVEGSSAPDSGSDEGKGGEYAYWLSSVKAPEAWEAAERYSDVTVAVIDTGVDASSEVFPQGVIDSENCYDTFTLTSGSCHDDHGHGTAVSAIISGEYASGGERVSGISGGATILGIKAGYKDAETGRGLVPTKNQLAAYDFLAARGASLGVRVVNMSYSGGFLGSPSHERVINRLAASGMVLFAAAGNNSSSAGFYPAEYENVISVSSLNRDDTLASFSNYGAGVEIAAPGVDILVPWNGIYGYYKGTSLSSPIVAGAAALVLADNPSLTAEEARLLLRDTATDIDKPGWDEISGSGKVNAYLAVNDVAALRFDGTDRYDTASIIANHAFSSAETAIIVSGADYNFPDALSASGLAGLLDAPIVPTAPDYLSAATHQTLISLGVEKAIIIGDTPSVSRQVEQSIRAIASVQSVERIAGTDRYHTSALIYQYAEDQGMSWTNPEGFLRNEYPAGHEWKNAGGKKTAILATGDDYPDALASSALSAHAHYPILLTTSTSLPASVEQVLATGSFDELIVVGSSLTISLSVANKAAALVSPAPLLSQPEKSDWFVSCAGVDRFDTARLIAEQAVLEGITADTAIVASGYSSIDASTVSVLKRPILLINPENDGATQYASSFIYDNAMTIEAIYATGSILSVPQHTFDACIESLIAGKHVAS